MAIWSSFTFISFGRDPGRRNSHFHVRLKKNSSEVMVKSRRVTQFQYPDTPKGSEHWNEPGNWHPRSFSSLSSCASLGPALPELSVLEKSSKLWYLPGIYGFLNVGKPFWLFKKHLEPKLSKAAHNFHFIKTLIRGQTLFSEALGAWRLM